MAVDEGMCWLYITDCPDGVRAAALSRSHKPEDHTDEQYLWRCEVQGVKIGCAAASLGVASMSDTSGRGTAEVCQLRMPKERELLRREDCQELSATNDIIPRNQATTADPHPGHCWAAADPQSHA
eukprot:1161741-Pelagomonas_calceolata.AAC.23